MAATVRRRRAREVAAWVAHIPAGTNTAVAGSRKIRCTLIARATEPLVAARTRAVRLIPIDRVCMAAAVAADTAQAFTNGVVRESFCTGSTAGSSVVVRWTCVALRHVARALPLPPARAVAARRRCTADVNGVTVAGRCNGAQRTAVWIHPLVALVAKVTIVRGVILCRAARAIRDSGPRVPTGALAIGEKPSNRGSVPSAIFVIRANAGAGRIASIPSGTLTTI